jgi:hypothetical protein
MLDKPRSALFNAELKILVIMKTAALTHRNFTFQREAIQLVKKGKPILGTKLK